MSSCRKPTWPDRRRALPRIAGWLLAAAALSSCSLDYGPAQIAQKLNENTPDLILYDFQNTSVRHGRKLFQISASYSESFDQKQQQRLSDVEFREFDDNGAVITSGTAEHALLYVDSNNVELSGRIRFYSETEKATVTCSYLFWDDKARTLTSRPDETVTITKDSGTVLSGRGFSADAARREVKFSGPVSGTVVAKDEESTQ